MHDELPSYTPLYTTVNPLVGFVSSNPSRQSSITTYWSPPGLGAEALCDRSPSVPRSSHSHFNWLNNPKRTNCLASAKMISFHLPCRG